MLSSSFKDDICLDFFNPIIPSIDFLYRYGISDRDVPLNFVTDFNYGDYSTLMIELEDAKEWLLNI